MLRIIKEVHQSIILARLSKVFFEFTTVVSLDALSDKRSDSDELPEEITAIGRGVGFVGIGKGKPASDINASKDIAFDASSEDRDGIHLHQVARLLGHEAFSAGFLPGRLTLTRNLPLRPFMLTLPHLGILPRI